MKYLVSIAVLLAVTVGFDTFVVEPYEYFGFASYSLRFHEWSAIAALACLPLLLADVRVRRPSQFFFVIFYFTIYLPSIVILYKVKPHFFQGSERSLVLLGLCASVSIMAVGTRLPRISLKRTSAPKLLFAYGRYLAIACILLSVVVGLQSFSLVSIFSLNDLYGIRDKHSQFAGGLLSYASIWTTSFFLPALWALAGEGRKGRSLKAIIVLLYAYFAFAFGAKTLLVAPLALLTVSCVMRGGPNRFFALMGGALVVLLLAPFFLLLISQEVHDLVVGVFHFRTMAIPQLAFAVYNDFFREHPFTSMTHISVVSAIFGSVYNAPLPVVLFDHYGLGNYNANFLANDGIASFGVAGMVVMALVYSGVMYAMDVAARFADPKVIAVSLTVQAMYLGNVSLFTLLVSHGLLFSLVLFLASSARFNRGLKRTAAIGHFTPPLDPVGVRAV